MPTGNLLAFIPDIIISAFYGFTSVNIRLLSETADFFIHFTTWASLIFQLKSNDSFKKDYHTFGLIYFYLYICLNIILLNTKLTMNDEPICCPKCHSTQIHVDKRGFKLGRAIVGGVLTGNLLIGAAAGGIGRNGIALTCLKCGHKFKIGKEGKTLENSQQTPIEGCRVIKSEELTNTMHMYRCDCGKESSLPANNPICPKCGRILSAKHIFSIDSKQKGCMPILIILIISIISAFCY